MNIQSHDIGFYSSRWARGWVRAGPPEGSLAGAILVGIALLACGCGTAPSVGTGSATPSTSTGPSACRAFAGGTASGFTGFGSIAGFLSNGATAADSVSMMCSATGRIVVITDTLAPPAPADGAVQAAPGIPLLRMDTALTAAERFLPADQELTDDVTRSSCRVIRFRSATVAAELGADDPDGLVDVVLASAAGAEFHQQRIGDVLLRVGHGDSPTGC